MTLFSLSEASEILALYSSYQLNNKNPKISSEKSLQKNKKESIDESDLPPGFEDNFKERYDDLKELVLELHQKIKNKDFPSLHREKKIKELENRIKNRDYQNKVQLLKLEKTLSNLEDTYFNLSESHKSKNELDNIRVRIIEAKKKVKILKRKINN